MTMFPMPLAAKLERADRKAARARLDEAKSRKVKARSGGRCEMNDGGGRCRRRAVQVHHRISGIGVRGRGDSALAAHKLHLCRQCHEDVHAHVLVPDGTHYRRIT